MRHFYFLAIAGIYNLICTHLLIGTGKGLVQKLPHISGKYIILVPKITLKEAVEQMHRSLQQWYAIWWVTMQESGLWRQLTALKPVVCEPRGSGDEFEKIMSSYYDDIKRGAGGIFFAICRGKVHAYTLIIHPVSICQFAELPLWHCRSLRTLHSGCRLSPHI